MKYLTKSQFIEKLQRNMQLFFAGRDVNLQKKENKERLSRFIQEFFNQYNYTCDDIRLSAQKNKFSLKLKKLQRGKSTNLINLILK